MTPLILLVYSSSLFAAGLTRLLADLSDCLISGVLPIDGLTRDRLASTPASVIILEGEDSDPATAAATRLLTACSADFTLIRVSLGAPTLHVYRFDRPVPAGLDQLATIIRRATDLPAAAPKRDHPAGERA